MPFFDEDCARARESVSAQLDGELPELELDRLQTHLRICPECSAWAEQVRDATLCLREAALEVPQQSFALPRPARRWTVISAVALAAAAAVVATMFVAPPARRAAPGAGSGPRAPQATPVAPQRLVPSRFLRLPDGLYESNLLVAAPHLSFRPS